VRAKVRLCGRFLECDAKTRNEVSFFEEKNSRGAASSNGWMLFFFVNFIALGFLRECWAGENRG